MYTKVYEGAYHQSLQVESILEERMCRYAMDFDVHIEIVVWRLLHQSRTEMFMKKKCIIIACN